MNAMKNALAVFAILAALAGMAEEKGSLGTAFQDLQKDDQVEFVRAVNESMRTYKASTPEKRLQTIYAVNRDAVRAAPAKEKKAVIAEVFATAPMDALPTITDRFATELFSRKAAGFSDKDDSFTEFAAATLMRVRTRMRFLATHELPAARMTFAVIMVLKASEGNPADLRESVLFYIPTGSHELARKVWIPAALGEDGNAPSSRSSPPARRARNPPMCPSFRLPRCRSSTALSAASSASATRRTSRARRPPSTPAWNDCLDRQY